MTRWAAGKRLLPVVAVLLGALVVWRLLARPGEPGKQAQTTSRSAGSAGSAGGSAAAPAPPTIALPPGATYAQRFAALCAACHGASGRMETPLTPVLAGQPSLYVITQLYLFREGRRGNEVMTAVARTLTDDDLRGYSEVIGTLPAVPPPPPATPPDPARMARGQALAEQYKCVFCHGAGLAGGQQVPHIGGQHEEYLQASLRGFHDGSRPGYTQAMTEAVKPIPPEDLETLAYYVARFLGPV